MEDVEVDIEADYRDSEWFPPLPERNVDVGVVAARKLARAVISQALDDMVKPTACQQYEIEGEMLSARAFLTDVNPDLTLWCELADIKPELVIIAARKKAELLV